MRPAHIVPHAQEPELSHFIEGGNVYTADARLLIRNRFAKAKKHDLRIFVEDDLAKATKPAQACSVVFLMDQPYNQFRGDTSSVPKNLVRMHSWKDIELFLRNN